MIRTLTNRILKPALGMVGWLMTAGSSLAQITVVNTGSLVSPTSDDPTLGICDIVVTLGSNVRSRIGVASLVGAAGGVAATSSAPGASGSLATPVDDSWVIGVYTPNNAPTISGPFATMLHNGNSGSSADNADYQNVPSAGSASYIWTVSAPAEDNHVLAAFVPVSAVPANSFSNWISGYDVGGLDGLDDDADGDGIDNGVENFFGTHPGEFSQGLLVGTRSGNTFTFTHPRNASPAVDLAATYRWSTDLAAYHLDGGTSGGTTVSFTTEADTLSPGITRVTATVAGTMPGRLFIDIKVTNP